MEVFKQWKAFGLYFYVSSIRMKRRRSVDEKLRNRNKTLRRYKKALYGEQEGCCAECGGWFTEDGLEIHHLVPVSVAPNLMLAKRNLVLVCPGCHRKIHPEVIGDASLTKQHTKQEKGEEDGEL